jgi:hypothetical protein
MIRVTVRLPAPVHAYLKRAAKEVDLPVTAIVRIAINDWRKRQPALPPDHPLEQKAGKK